jgi:hypothetical protein
MLGYQLNDFPIQLAIKIMEKLQNPSPKAHTNILILVSKNIINITWSGAVQRQFPSFVARKVQALVF